jgi:hypothetical protein
MYLGSPLTGPAASRAPWWPCLLALGCPKRAGSGSSGPSGDQLCATERPSSGIFWGSGFSIFKFVGRSHLPSQPNLMHFCKLANQCTQGTTRSASMIEECLFLSPISGLYIASAPPASSPTLPPARTLICSRRSLFVCPKSRATADRRSFTKLEPESRHHPILAPGITQGPVKSWVGVARASYHERRRKKRDRGPVLNPSF